jgi:hypothetical protein
VVWFGAVPPTLRLYPGGLPSMSYLTPPKLNQPVVRRIEGKKVALIDGPQLVELMLDNNIGVIQTKKYELKEVSDDFFDEDQG